MGLFLNLAQIYLIIKKPWCQRFFELTVVVFEYWPLIRRVGATKNSANSKLSDIQTKLSTSQHYTRFNLYSSENVFEQFFIFRGSTPLKFEENIFVSCMRLYMFLITEAAKKGGSSRFHALEDEGKTLNFYDL